MDRFLLGFAIGVGIGVAYVVFNAPKSGEETRGDLGQRLRAAASVARQASSAREQELWTQFRARLAPNASASELPGLAGLV